MRVSVVIPCYNVAAYLKECIASVRSISEEAPIILVDNASTDQTPELMEQLAREYDGVYCMSETQPGAPFARNTGLSRVETPWVQFLDADDLLLPNAFRNREMEEAHIVSAAYVKRSVSGQEQNVQPDPDFWKGLFNTQLGITSSIVWQTQTVREAGGWDGSLKSSQEYDLMFRCLQMGANLKSVSTPTAVVRERESGQISQGDPSPRWHRYLDLRARMMTYLKEEESAYFLEHASAFYQQLFDHIRTLSNSDVAGAIKRYKSMIPADFAPQPSAATGILFIRLMRVFGFAGATRIRRLLP